MHVRDLRAIATLVHLPFELGVEGFVGGRLCQNRDVGKTIAVASLYASRSHAWIVARQRLLAPLGIAPGSLDKASGSDISPMLEAGHHGVSLHQDGTRYSDVHHTPDDTLDKVDAEDLRQNVAAWTATLAILSGGIEPEPKPSRGKRR